jgi:putative endonuclease
MWIVYVLYSLSAKRRYVGFTSNLNRRLIEHNNGYNRSTKAYKPWIVVYTEEYVLREEARKREVYLKSGVGREFLNNKLDL